MEVEGWRLEVERWAERREWVGKRVGMLDDDVTDTGIEVER